MFLAETASHKILLQKRFAEDVSHRVQAEIRACTVESHRKMMKKKLWKTAWIVLASVTVAIQCIQK